MRPLLELITVTDFRSIRGSITVHLNAPVVLIHGANGSGKTSLLSAIELALTGQVLSFNRVDPSYTRNLTHWNATASRIVLSVDGSTTEVNITKGQVIQKPLLSGDVARYFGERCYLAQSTLGRLLELYQHTDAQQTESPLTRFVKDLLGLDQLDALVEGLHVAGDVRRLRRAVPEYRNIEDAKTRVAQFITRARLESARLAADSLALRNSIREKLGRLAPEAPAWIEQPAVLEEFLLSDAEGEELTRLAAARRELNAIRSEWKPLAAEPEASERLLIENGEKEVRARLDIWRSRTGQNVETLIGQLRATFADLPSPASTDPEYARGTALAAVRAELDRCSRQLEQDAIDSSRASEIEGDIGRGSARLAAIEEQMADLGGDAQGLAHALAQLLPHVTSNVCPVCGRDFAEVSPELLAMRVSGHVARLTERAGRLEALSKERTEATSDLTIAQRERDNLRARQLSAELKTQIRARRAQLLEAAAKLDTLTASTIDGAKLLRAAAESSRRLAELRGRDQRATALREAVGTLATTLGQGVLDDAEGIHHGLDRLEGYLKERQEFLAKHWELRRSTRDEWRKLAYLEAELRSQSETIQREVDRLERLNEALAEADARRQVGREIAHAARQARTAIVRRIFTDSLNAIWRALFIRLAPDEQFVPAFAIPESAAGRVEAILETVHRGGGRGGSPEAMLSGGNLNTAALTLFLALHLAVEPKLRWLILDDPVQSMDEVHIAQLAALLRTLSKLQERQIVIAVHEKPLFDYLALELSPSFQDDRLITVELGAAADGSTVADVDFRVWEPDPVVAYGS